MTDFRTKNVPLDWSRVLQFDVDRLSQQHPEQIDKELEDLYEVLVEAHLRPGDPQATPENLLRLFRVTQVVMEHRECRVGQNDRLWTAQFRSPPYRNKNLYLVQAEEDIRALETRVQQQDDEMDGLMTGGDASYVAEIRTLREDIEDLEKRNDALTRDLAEAEEQLDAERSSMREMTAQLSTERARASALEEAATRMKAEIKDYQSQIQNRKDRLQLKNMDEDQIRKQLREKNGEINRYLAEVELLSAENTRLTDEVRAMSQELEATVTELDRKESELEEIQRVIIDNDNTIDQLIDERAALQTKLEDLTQQVETVGFQDERFLTELQEEVESYKQAMRDSESDASEKAMLIQRLKGDILNLQEELKTYNVDAVSKAMSEKDDIIATLQDKLNEAYQDFELLSIDWDNIDKALHTKSEIDIDSLRNQLETANRLKENLHAYKARHKKNLQKIRAVDAQLEEKERELIGLRERISQYEGGVYGLQEAVKEIKDLKLRLNLRDKDLLSRTQQINEWERRLGDLIDENQELRRLLGMDEKSSVDVTNVKHIRTVELEKARALNTQLQQEIDRLEEERLQLKASMRLRAMERGERAVQLGMTAEDMADVDDYAEKLRIKRGEVTSGYAVAATVIHSDQLEKLAVELERAQVDGSEARQQVKKLEEDMRRLQNDNANLEAAVKEVSRTLIQLQSNNEDSSTESLLSELDAVHKLVDILEKKQRIEKTRDLLQLDAGKDVLKALRDDLQGARDKIRLVQTELENLRAEIRLIREDRDHWKLEAQNPRKCAVTLPTELSIGSAEDYRALVEQLAECITELQRKDVALEQSKAALENYRDSYGMLAGRQRQLYRDYQNLKQENAEKAASLEANLRDADAAREAAQIRTEELEALVVTLSAGSDELVKSSLVDVQRKLMVLKINEKALTRRYLALQEVESGLRTENERLKNDLLLLDKASRQRIGYLAASKREAKSKVERLLSELSESVPRSEHIQLENRLNLYVAKTRQLLEKEQHWIGERIRCEEEVQRAQTLQNKMHIVELELTEAKEKASKMEDALLKAAQSTQKGLGDQQSLVGLQHKVATLEVKVQVLQNRAEIAERKCRAMTEAETETKKRLDSMDHLYMAAKEENIKLREAEVEFRNSFAGGASRAEHERNLARITELETAVEQLTQDVTKYKYLADIATTQSADMVHHHAMNEKEKSILRAAVEELQMEGDEKLVIGKLHQHILTLQMSEATIVRKLEAAHANTLRLESTVVQKVYYQLEKSIDERDNIIFQLRLDQKSSMRLLQKSASDLRAKLAGAVYLDKYERACERTRILEARKTEVDKNLQTLLDQKRSLDDNLADTKLKLESQEELLEALRNHSASTERIAAWHSKMAALQLADLRLQRDIAREREAYHATKRELRDNVVRLAQLEEEYVSLQSEFDARQLEWEKRQEELEATICNYEEERDRIFQAATATEFKDVVPDRSLPVGQQLETALRLLVERGRLVTAQEIKISTLEGKVRTLETQLQTNVDELYKSKSDLTHLRLEVTTKQINETNTAHNVITAKEGVFTFDQVRDREGEAIRVAKETVASLQRQLTAKDELVEKYRKMLKDVRGEMMSHKEEYKTALQERTDTINALSDRQLERIRRPHEHSQSTANREREADSGAIEEWEKMLAAKEQELLGLQMRMKGIEEVAEATRSDLQEKIHLLSAELDEKQHQIDGKMLELSTIRLELNEAQLKAEEPPSKKMVNLVNQLRQELEKKDAKQVNLIKVIQELKESMMQTAEEAAKMKIEETHGRADVEELVQQRTRELSDQISELEGKVQRMNKAKAGERIEELEKAVQKLKEEVSKRDIVIANQATEIRKLQGNLKERRLQMTNSKISEARNRDPHKHQTPEEQGTLGIRDHQPQTVQALRADEDKITNVTKERWEMEKKYQKRLETLKEKLSCKVKESEEASRTVSSLRESLARTERERSRLQHKLQAASAQLAVAQQLPKGQAYGEGICDDFQGEDQALEHRRHLDELEKSRQRIYELETAIEQWKKRAVVQPTKETEQARHEARQLRERLQTLEELNEQLRRSRGAFSRSPEPGGINPDAKMGEKTASLVSVLESRIRDFVNKYEALETEKLKTDNDLLECRFERDEANDARMRLERRLQELEEIKEAEERRKEAENQATIPGFTIPLTKLRSAPHLFLERSPQELAAVIQHLARSNERLRKDRESVQKYGASQSKYVEAVKEIKRLKKELGQKGEETRAVSEEMKKIARVEEENAKLRRQLRQERDKATKHFARGQELEMTKEKLHDELMQVRKALGGIKLGAPGINEDEHCEEEKMDVEALVERLKELTKQLAERDGMIEGFLKTDKNETTNLAAENRKLSRELEMWRVRATKLTEQIASETSRSRQHVVKPGGEVASRDASPSALPRDSEELAALQSRLNQVERENAELKDELAAFDPAFFEELEDLKWNYRESVRVNLQYEDIIRDLCEKTGVNPHAVLTTVEKDDSEGGGG
ncbi:hypothetical protein SpCBS45565_g02947 [Spizellomyces sp. 'palustris']|nr:hypothetical protein SpCBS45565_g02947 [Spizellomyces sp. 'palustris']